MCVCIHFVLYFARSYEHTNRYDWQTLKSGINDNKIILAIYRYSIGKGKIDDYDVSDYDSVDQIKISH